MPRRPRVFQLGHQNRQVEANEKAKQIYRQGLLGPVNLVEIATNRNSPWGAWVWNIHPKGNAKTIDWETFQEGTPPHMCIPHFLGGYPPPNISPSPFLDNLHYCFEMYMDRTYKSENVLGICY